MAVWLSYGLKQDPLARLIKDTVSMWVTLWKDMAEHNRMDTRKAWRLAYGSLLAGEAHDQVVWARVRGPISATIATLTSQGWQVPYADLLPRGPAVDPVAP